MLFFPMGEDQYSSIGRLRDPCLLSSCSGVEGRLKFFPLWSDFLIEVNIKYIRYKHVIFCMHVDVVSGTTYPGFTFYLVRPDLLGVPARPPLRLLFGIIFMIYLFIHTYLPTYIYIRKYIHTHINKKMLPIMALSKLDRHITEYLQQFLFRYLE